ncbi:MAG TPA: membrane protein insertion efficiency factor YidD [Vicinamibacterales bacterium]
MSASTPAASETRRRRLTRARLILLLLAAAAAADLARAPDRQLSARVLRAGIHTYQATLSPLMPALGVRCRFKPTCSHYADAVIARDGALTGSWRTARRLVRCGPWTPAGTLDPP